MTYSTLAGLSPELPGLLTLCKYNTHGEREGHKHTQRLYVRLACGSR